MLDFITPSRPLDGQGRSQVPGLDYYIPDSRRPARQADPALRPELAALEQMFGYWRES